MLGNHSRMPDRLPSLFAITTGSLPSNTATQEFVVPKSIPIIFPMIVIFLFIIYSLISFCPVVSPALIKEPRRERTLTKKQTVCQKEIIRMHDIISAKKTVLINKHC